MLSRELLKVIIEGKEYIRLCKSEDLYEGKGKQFILGDETSEQVAVFRVKSKLYCLSNICPHRHQDQIFNGIIEDFNVMCPVHGWTYSLRTGENVIKKQGVRSLLSFEIFEKDGLVYMEFPKFDLPLWRIADPSVEQKNGQSQNSQ